jgi:hypothetical protein
MNEKYEIQDSTFIDSVCAILVKHDALKNKDASDLKKSFEAHSALYFEDFLLEEELVEKEALLRALSELYGLPALDVVGVFFDHHLVTMFPKDVMLRNGFIPYERDGDVLLVVAARPNSPKLPEIIGKFVSYDVTFLAGIYRDICDMVKEFYDASIEKADISVFEDTRDEHTPVGVDETLDTDEGD